MSKIYLAGIIAIAKNGVIGNDNKIPWSLPNDLKLFRKITMGHPVIMGRKTFESIGKLLPGRQNIILSRDTDYKVDGAIVINNPSDLYKINLQSNKVFVIGGLGVYSTYFNQISEWFVSRLHHEYIGDTYFDYDFDKWSDKQELIHCDDDFTTTRYIKDSKYFDFELYTHSLTPEQEQMVRYKDYTKIKNFPGLVKEEIIQGQSYSIHVNLYENGDILFKAVPYHNLDRSALALIHEKRFYDVVRPKKIMGYSDEEVTEAYNNIVQYARNLFVVTHNDLEPLTVDKRLADCMWEFMLKQVNTLPKSFAWVYKSYGAEDYINYYERMFFAEECLSGNVDLLRPDQFQDIDLYNSFVQCWEENIVERIYNIARTYLTDNHLWAKYNLTKKTYQNLNTIKRMGKRHLFDVWNLCSFILAALTYKTNGDYRNWERYFEEKQIIERVIAKLFVLYREWYYVSAFIN